MPYCALLSDLDGTLLDTLRDMANAVNVALGRLGFPPHETLAYRQFVGDGRRTMALRALPQEHRDDAVLETLLDYIAEEYQERWMLNSVPYPGIPELLDELTSRGVRLSVLSNKPQMYAEPMVSTILSRWSFEHVVGETPGVPRKPDPSGALHIISRMGLEPRDCIYMGDSGVDMETAAAAGMYPVGVLWGFRNRQELLDSGAKVLLEHPLELLRVLEESAC